MRLETAIRDHATRQYAHMVFALTGAVFLGYAIFRYIGWKNSVEDLRIGFASWSIRRKTRAPVASPMPVDAPSGVRSD